MNWRTTLVMILLGLGLAAWWVGERTRHGEDTKAAGARVLEGREITSLRKLEWMKGDAGFVIERKGAGGSWSLPGNWPTRNAEVNAIAEAILGLRTRFVPIANEGETETGLSSPKLKIKLGFGKPEATTTEDVILEFAEPASVDSGNRFATPTFVRVQPSGIVMRLGPGIIRQLDHPVDYFQQRRLFTGERLSTKADGSLSSSQKSEKLVARAVAVELDEEGKKTSFQIEQKDNEWILGQPVGMDYLEPKARDAMLSAIPDLWAEKFVRVDLAKAGLDKPARTLRVTREDGTMITLRIGAVSSRRETRKPRPPQPGMPPGMPPQEEVIIHEMRYAKLDGNDQIFEIVGDKLKDVFVAVDQLRDPQVARFNTTDVTRLEIRSGSSQIHIVRDNLKWRLEKPVQSEADGEKVNELLSKLSALEAKGADVIDQPKLPEYELEKPALSIQLTLLEESKNQEKQVEEKKKTSRTIQVHFGKQLAREKKVFAQRQGVTRVDRVEDSLVNLLSRPVMAYRGKRALDLQAPDIQSLDIVSKAGKVQFRKALEGKWTVPDWKDIAIDDPKVSQLASNLSSLEALEYVEETPSEKDLKELFGLVEPALVVEIGLAGKDTKPRKLSVGKTRGEKPGYFARLDGNGPVFAVGNETVQNLQQDSLAYLPMDFWKLLPEEIASWSVERQGKLFTLERKENVWKITKPFEADAFLEKLTAALPLLAAPRAEKYVEIATKDGAKFGFDKPLGKLIVTDKEKKQKLLVVGGKVDEKTGLRHARLGDNGPVALIPKPLSELLETDALALLDPVAFKVDTSSLRRIQLQGKKDFKLARKDADWLLEQAVTGSIPADQENIFSMINLWFNLKVEKYVGYGVSADLKSFGLEKPAQKITIEFENADKKSVTKQMLLGDAPKDGNGGLFAKFEGEPAVFLLTPAQVKILSRDYLAYVPRQLWKWPADQWKSWNRKGPVGELDITQKDESWKINAPGNFSADEKVLQEMAALVSDLKLDTVLAYAPKELKEFGLDVPFATMVFQEAGNKRTLLVGKEVDAKTGQRYAMVEKEKTIGVLAPEVARKLLAGPLFFRDRAITRFPDADQLVLERGARKATFQRVEGNWKLTQPISADADQQLIDDTIDMLARLRADELVVEKPKAEDLKKYGLEKPALVWSIRSGGKSVLELQLGRRDESGRRTYVMIPGKEMVFLLDPKLTSSLEGEFRNRTVWNPGLDAVQVESIKYSSESSSFEMVKKDNQWQNPGKPSEKVNDGNLNLTLSSLAGLKLERYVVDDGASLNLFGLEKPEWTIELGTPQGKRVLQIGRPEGGSARLYARLADSKARDVFLISETDAILILKPYNWFHRKN